MFHVLNSVRQNFCKITGLGHTESIDSDLFRVVSQLDFIKSLPEPTQLEITKNGQITIEEAAANWDEMISHKRTFYDGHIADLGFFAVKRLIEQSDFTSGKPDLNNVDVIIGASNTGPGYPSLADFVKEKIGVRNDSSCFDVTEACTAGSVALMQASALIKSGQCKKVLVVCAEKATTLTPLRNWQGSNLFGDAAFCVLLEASDNPEDESFKFFNFKSFPFDGHLEMIRKTENGFVQDGKKVHLFIVKEIVAEIMDTIQKAGIELNNIKHLVFHQPSNKTISSLDTYLRNKMPDLKAIFHYSKDIGNASSACFGHLLSRKYYEGLIGKGELVLTCTFGAGLSMGIIGLNL